ncbi:MAG: gluconate 2-dehydrogenase subunit 3 family protein [Rhodothermaceae bacterium]|nr:gluconate 2-dehydrogenase subunit 3 family protein [Rhodothermaceae bacterium]MYB90165.1 gluconate 2-dehydrogenase subunit 3 family protein [Rhodothermaceae bacterium]MYD69029.1 gluconate 2-dehydrogenase subunit 3 family protein [Rhodothermaceae bacterium]MYG45762.1 gluconate 2-dehydrogenase subunit 3 family protein [Rhodothermaceae bacterium]MYJ06874.1 gluconate 2-dehydrogenase subunit 3 family protein [Rhodothermaceae bacterium]
MDRRTALQRIALLMGCTISASTVAGVLGGCSAGRDGVVFEARTLTQGRDELVATLSELIIPETDTPGARAAKVHEFADNMLTDWYDEAEVEEFLAGLEDVQRRAGDYDSASFMDLDPDRQIEILTQMEKEVEVWRENGELGTTPFFQTIKSLTLFGYYTSEVGATQELRVNPMGVYRPDIPFSEIGRAWA